MFTCLATTQQRQVKSPWDPGVVSLHVNAGHFSTTARRVTSPTWGPPPPCKQALNHILENTTRVEIIITISKAIRIKNNKNFGSYIRAIFAIICDCNFNPCGIFEKTTSFCPILNQDLEQGKLMAAVNSRK